MIGSSHLCDPLETYNRYVNHGQPPGADVAAIADVGSIRRNLVFTI